MHPRVIAFFASLSGQPARYFHKEKDGEYIAAYALLGNNKTGVEQWKKFPLSYDEIMIPAAKDASVFFLKKQIRCHTSTERISGISTLR